jgi:hypothetical protein
MPEIARQHFDRLYAAWQTAAWKGGRSWCGLMHDSPMWPIHGQYQCGACGRSYSVPWDGDRLPLTRAKLADVVPGVVPEVAPVQVLRQALHLMWRGARL